MLCSHFWVQRYNFCGIYTNFSRKKCGLFVFFNRKIPFLVIFTVNPLCQRSCAQPAAQCIMSCSASNVLCIMFDVFYIIHLTLFIIHYSLFIIHYSLFIVPSPAGRLRGASGVGGRIERICLNVNKYDVYLSSYQWEHRVRAR